MSTLAFAYSHRTFNLLPHLLASLSLLAMTALALLHWLALPELPLWISGAFGWLGLFLLLISSPGKAFQQFFALSAAGLLLLLTAVFRGADIALEPLLQQNNSLIVMLFCVGFLRLVADAALTNEPLPQGKLAYVKTLLGVHLLGAVINASILVLVAERLKSQQALGRQSLIVIARGFSMAAFWSPFFAAMAVALTYAPGAELIPVMLTGLGLTAIALIVTVLEQGGRRLDKLDAFRGYPTHASNLLIPALLAISVLVLHSLFPDLPVLTLVSATAIVLTIAFLFIRRRDEMIEALNHHIRHSAPRMGRELSLFLGAAVLTIGLQALFSTFTDFQPLTQFRAFEFSALLGMAVCLSLLGLHPVVSISLIGPMLTPLSPPPNALAALYLCIWSLGVVANPYSGINAILRSHFELSSKNIIGWNLRYVLIMWGIICLLATWLTL